MIPVMTVPILNRPDLLHRLVRSIDVWVDVLVIVDNGGVILDRGEYLQEISKGFVGRVDVIQHRNAGVAASWNEVIKLYPADSWMLVNNDIQFTPGDLMSMIVAGGLPDVGAVYGNHGASWWMVTKLGIERVGLFDENFFPAYLEDCDWSRRADLAHVRRHNAWGEAIHGEGGGGSCTIMSDPDLRERNGYTHGGNFSYYRRKWGGNNGEEVFESPFNSGLPVDFWCFEPATRAVQMAMFENKEGRKA